MAGSQKGKDGIDGIDGIEALNRLPQGKQVDIILHVRDLGYAIVGNRVRALLVVPSVADAENCNVPIRPARKAFDSLVSQGSDCYLDVVAFPIKNPKTLSPADISVSCTIVRWRDFKFAQDPQLLQALPVV